MRLIEKENYSEKGNRVLFNIHSNWESVSSVDGSPEMIRKDMIRNALLDLLENLESDVIKDKRILVDSEFCQFSNLDVPNIDSPNFDIVTDVYIESIKLDMFNFHIVWTFNDEEFVLDPHSFFQNKVDGKTNVVIKDTNRTVTVNDGTLKHQLIANWNNIQ